MKCAVVVPFATGLLSLGSSNSGSSTSTSATILFVPLLAFLYSVEVFSSPHERH